MELRQLKTFRTVATVLSFHRASEILNYAQSTVSAQIRALETGLGVPLFDRLGRRICLTAAGQKLLRYAERLLDLEEETLSEMSDVNESHTVLAVRMPQTLCNHYLPEILCRFGKKYPLIGFDISTCDYHGLQRELKTGVVDVAFLLADEHVSPELKTEILAQEEIVLVANTRHHLAKKGHLRFEDLQNETILLPKHDCAYKMDLEQSFAQNKINALTIIALNSIESIKQCLLKNVGIGLLPKLTIRKELDEGRLVAFPSLSAKPEVNVIMLIHRDKWLSPILKAFIRETRAVFKQGN